MREFNFCAINFEIYGTILAKEKNIPCKSKKQQHTHKWHLYRSIERALCISTLSNISTQWYCICFQSGQTHSNMQQQPRRTGVCKYRTVIFGHRIFKWVMGECDVTVSRSQMNKRWRVGKIWWIEWPNRLQTTKLAFYYIHRMCPCVQGMEKHSCSNCQCDISGFRIRCAECPDFDLCLQASVTSQESFRSKQVISFSLEIKLYNAQSYD